MNYLVNLGFPEDIVEVLSKNIPEKVIEELKKNESVVATNINCLKSLGITNHVDSFASFYNMFLIDTKTFDDIFSKYDTEDLIAKLEKNVAIMEYL